MTTARLDEMEKSQEGKKKSTWGLNRARWRYRHCDKAPGVSRWVGCKKTYFDPSSRRILTFTPTFAAPLTMREGREMHWSYSVLMVKGGRDRKKWTYNNTSSVECLGHLSSSEVDWEPETHARETRTDILNLPLFGNNSSWRAVGRFCSFLCSTCKQVPALTAVSQWELRFLPE